MAGDTRHGILGTLGMLGARIRLGMLLCSLSMQQHQQLSSGLVVREEETEDELTSGGFTEHSPALLLYAEGFSAIRPEAPEN